MRRLTVFASVIAFIFALFCISRNLAENDTEEQMFKDLLCQSCHFSKIWQEWQETTHAKSWQTPEFPKLAKKSPKGLECGSCHAPKPIMITGLGKIPLIREKDLDYGVSCVVCHLGTGGNMNGPEPTKQSSLHGYIIRPPVEAVKLCGTCHGQKNLSTLCAGDNNPVDMKVALQNLKDDSSANCMQCHMPEVEKPRKRSLMSLKRVKDRKHLWLSHESSVYKDAAQLKIDVKQDYVTVTVINKTSHSLPTERGSSLKLVVNVKGDNDGLVACKQDEYAKDSDTQIKAGKKSEFVFGVKQPFKEIEAKLSYVPSPKRPKAEEFVVVNANYIQ